MTFGYRRGLTLALGAAALLAGACQRQDDASRRQARGGATATQESAEQARERAADAQDKAAEERGDVARAQKDVAQEQEDLAKARGEAGKEAGEARAADQQASQASKDAQQQATAATGQDATAPAGQRSATGQVVSAKQDELVLRQGSGAPDLKLKVSPSTTVMMGGREASVSELKEGTQVRASYQQEGDDQQAIRIEALTGAAGSGPSNIGAPPAERSPGTTGATGTERP